MSNYSTLKAAISAVIKENNNHEITGQVLQTTLLAMVDSLAGGYLFKGIATPATVVGTPDENVFYIGGGGLYSNFGATPVNVPDGCIGIFTYNGSFENHIIPTGGVFDISAYNAVGGTPATYANLQAALGTNGENIPDYLQKGGMRVKFIQGNAPSSDNKYVQARCMAQNFSTDPNDWQGVDDTPTACSKNLVESGGVADKFAVILGKEEQNIDLSNYEANNGVVITDLIFRNDGLYGNHRYKVIPIIAGRTIRVTPVSTSIGANILPMKDNVFVDRTVINVCDGVSDETYYQPVDIEIPSDAKYLYVYTRDSNEVSHEPTIKYLAVEGLIEKLQEEKLDANQEAINEGKILGIDVNGNVVPIYNYGPENKERLDDLEIDLYGSDSHEILDTSNPVAGTLVSGQWKTNGLYGYWLNAVLFVGNYKGRTLRIVPKSTEDGTTYTFLKDNVLIHNENVNLCDGYTDTLTVYSTTEMPIPSDAEYLLVRLNNTNTLADKTPQSLLILAQEGDLDKKVDKVAGKGLSTNDYTDEDKEKVASIPTSFVSPSDLDNYVPKEQGIENAGLLLKVGTDGKVTLGAGGGVVPDVTDCVRKDITRTLYLGANVLSGVIGVGTGWTENAGNYTHTTGDTSPLVFPLATDSGDAYVAILSYSAIGQREAAVYISIGYGVPCDIYNGTLGPFYVGMVSDGGNLKITAVSNYDGTISGVELRKVVTEEDAEISVTLDTSNNKHYENVSAGTTSGNITGWWNIAIGATDSLSSNQNGSRCIAIGQRSLLSMQGGTRNIGIGTFSLCRFIYGNGNIAIGADAGWYMTGGNDNVMVGKGAFGEVRASNPQSNIAIGKSALSQNTLQNPENNVAIGEFALAGGSSSTAKTNCVAVGNSAGRSNNTKCVAIGVNAAFYMMGQGNVAIGYDAMNFYNVDGQNNVCIGHLAKLYPPSRPATINNAIAIGYNARATKSNQVVIGNTDNDEFVLGGKKLVFNEDNTITWVAI